MNTYFSINPKVYHSDELKIALILRKMDTRKGVVFSEKWYNKMANATIKPEEKTLIEFTKDYDQNFNPFDSKLRARRDLSKPSKDRERTKTELLMTGSRSTSTGLKTLQPRPTRRQTHRGNPVLCGT